MNNLFTTKFKLHTSVGFNCGICGDRVDRQRPLVALVGNEDSTALEKGFIDPFATAVRHYGGPDGIRIGKWMICGKNGPCYHDRRGLRRGPSMGRDLEDGNKDDDEQDDKQYFTRTCCTVHTDCLQQFMRHCTASDALDRLWQTSVWGSEPWTGRYVPHLDLLIKPSEHVRELFLHSVERCGLQLQNTLPPEVVDMIIRFALPQTYSYTGCLLPQTCNSNQELRRRLSGELYYPLWRNVTALDLAHRLSAATPALPLVTVPLSRVLAWQRGAPPTLAPEESAGFLPSIIRLTIDLQGLKSVERLSQRPLLRSRERFDDSRFIIEEEAYFGPTIAHFRNGLSRLKMPMNAGDQAGNAASTWDTPTPPDIHQLESHVMQHRNSAAWTSFRTVDLDQISGITMLFKSPHQSISPHTPSPLIHTHSLSRPCAEFTFGNSPPGFEWIYVPLPRDDTLLACGTVVQPQLLGPLFDSVRSCFLFRFKLAGEVTVGLYSPHEAFLLREGPQKTLIHCQSSPVLLTTAPSGQGHSSTFSKPFYYPDFSVLGLHWHFSHASLENVCKTQVFYEDDGIHCRGMLIEYNNGSQRALGECRLLVDRSETYHNPSLISFANTKRLRSRNPRWPKRLEECEAVQVRFDGVAFEGDTWTHSPMTGTLTFWFFWAEARILHSKTPFGSQ